METLEIEDLWNLRYAIDYRLSRVIGAGLDKMDSYSLQIDSLLKSKAIIEQLIKDKEFERDQTTLNKL